MADGFHVLMGQGGSKLLSYAHRISAAKCLTGAYETCLELKRLNPRIRITARTLTTDYGMVDCPQPWMYGDASVWWSLVRAHLPAGFDYYEIQNECPPPPGGYAKWAQWSIEMAQYVATEKGGALLAFSFGPGNPPDPRDWFPLIEYMQWAEQHPLPNGRVHGIAFHAAAYAPWTRADSPWINDPWIAGRHMMIAALLREQGFDLYASPITLAVTEVGVTDGYSGNWDAVYTPQEKAAAYRATRDTYIQQELVDMFHWWNISQIGMWEDDSAMLPYIW